MVFTQSHVRKFMRRVADEHRDPVTDEINMTTLAEHTADEFDMAHDGGPLDDPDHWIWEEAMNCYSADLENAEDACPGCGCRPGEGRTPGCHEPIGCGFTP